MTNFQKPSFLPFHTLFGGGFACFLVIVCVLAGKGISAQLTVNNAIGATFGVQNVLLGEGVTVSNITFSGSNQQIGSFNCVSCNLGIGTGLVMGTGNVSGCVGPNNSGGFSLGPPNGSFGSDPDLTHPLMAGPTSLFDVAVLQFDFVPQGDSVAFKFVFGSEEYPEYVFQFNDVFGFFLSGPGISGPFTGNAANIAVIPNTGIPGTAVTINNVNNISNSQYYVPNGSGSQSPFNSSNYYIQPDGFTRVLTARATVQCGQTYHIKLAIADVLDGLWDSWVFLEAGSFQSNQMEVAYTGPEFSPGANSVYESCDPAYLIFTRPGDQVNDFTYNLSIQGVAQNGVDYQLIPATLNFAANSSTATIPIVPIDDSIFEGPESLIITILGDEFCNDMGPTYTVYITDIEPLEVILPDVEINCGDSVTLTPAITGGAGYYRVIWQGNYLSPSLSLAPDAPMTINYVVADTCGVDPYMGTVNITFPNYPPIEVDLGPDQVISCLDTLFITPLVSGGYGMYEYEWVNGGQPVSLDSALSLFGGAPGPVLLNIMDQCGATGQGTMNLTYDPIPVFVDIGPDITASCLDEVPLTSTVSGGIGSYSYLWITDAGVNVGLTDQLMVYPTDGSVGITLAVTDQCGNVGTDEVLIDVPPVPVIVNAGPDTGAECLENVTVVATATGGIGNYSYAWTSALANLSFDAVCIYQVNGGNAILTAIVEDECGNIGQDQVLVELVPSPISLTLTPDTAICNGGQMVLEAFATGGVGSLDYTWSPGGSHFTNLTVEPAEATIYTMTVEDQCGNSALDDVLVEVGIAEAGFTAEYIGDFGIQLTNHSPNAYSSVWTFGDGTVTTDESPYHLFTDFNPWVVNLQIISTGGCTAEETKVFYPLANVYIPNCFTPDGDGINDVFQARGHDLQWFKLWIFNRWGEVVYYSEDINGAWDGSHLGGDYFSPDGSFTYQVEAQGIRGNVIEKSGIATLIR